MTEAEWDGCCDPSIMLDAFLHDPDRADLGLFGCACCRRIWSLLTDKRLQRGVQGREQFERGLVSKQEVEHTEWDASIARSEIRTPLKFNPNVGQHSVEAAPAWAAAAAANAAFGNYRAASDFAACARACTDGGDWQKSYDAERAAQCDLLRSMVAYSSRA